MQPCRGSEPPLPLPQSIDPTLLLTAFLPILLFAGAFALEWHTMRRLMWSSLLLAGAPTASPASLLCTC